jgi:hypothetical protein
MSDAAYDDVKKEVHNATSDKPHHLSTSSSNDNMQKVFEAATNAGLGDAARELKTKIHAATQLHYDEKQ